MDILKCSAFVTAVEEGSILAASKKLNYTSSGVNRMINSLEEELNVTLLNRSRSGVELTEIGWELLPLFKELIVYNDEVARVCSQAQDTGHDMVSIGGYHEIIEFKLPPILNKLKLLYPNVQVNVFEAPHSVIMPQLRDREFDFAIIYDQVDDDMLFEPLYKEEIVLMRPKDGTVDPDEKFPVKDLESIPLISFGNSPVELANCIKEYGLELNICYSSLSIYTLNKMVVSGLGFATINASEMLCCSDDVICQHFDPPVYAQLGIAYYEESMRPMVNRFANLILASLGEAFTE